MSKEAGNSNNNQQILKTVTETKQKTKEDENLVWNAKTLPREILKWIQGLDLSYSVRDPRRDLNNGFLVAEIFSRYYPGKIQMHSFDNSQNFSRKKNNWELLDLFFQKNEVPLSKNDWKDVLLDNDAEALISTLIKIYQFLTQRKVTKPPLANYVKEGLGATSLSGGDHGTTSFLLKDKGLEKLEDKKEEKLEDDNKNKKLDGSIAHSENKAHLTNASSKRTNFLRVPSKPIAQNIENVNFQIDVKNLNVRQVTGSILKLRENKLLNNEENHYSIDKNSNLASNAHLKQSQQHGLGSNTIESNGARQSAGQTEKLENGGYNSSKGGLSKKDQQNAVLELVNALLLQCLQENPEELQKFKLKNQQVVQFFVDSVDVLSEGFVQQFLAVIQGTIDTYVSVAGKDPNELWKFMGFLFTTLFNLGAEKEDLVLALYEIINDFGQKSMYKDPNKVKHVFVEFYLEKFAEQIKSCLLFSKKEVLIKILYSFCVPTAQARHQMISSYKEVVRDSHSFMQALVVLIKFENQYNEQNQQLFQNFLHYATLHLFSSSASLRSMSLSIFTHIVDLNQDEVFSIIQPKIAQIQKNQWWENKCLSIILFSKIIRGIVNSEKYQNLVVNPQANQKFFNIETEKQINEMKEQIEVLAQGIRSLSLPITSGMVLQTTFIQIVESLGDSKTLQELFLALILDCSEEIRHWVLHSQDGQQNQSEIQDKNNGNAAEVISLNYGQKQQGQIPESRPGDQYIYYVNSDKSLKYKTNINSTVIRKFASSILINLIDLIRQEEDSDFKMSYEHLDLIAYCFQYTDFKIINMEQCELIANTVKQYIFFALCEENMCQEACKVVAKILELMFFSDVKLSDVSNLFAMSICLIYKNGVQITQDTIEELVRKLVEDGYTSGIEQIKIFLQESYKAIKQKNGEVYLKGSKLLKIIEPVIEHNDRLERQNSADQQANNNQIHGSSTESLVKQQSNGVATGGFKMNNSDKFDDQQQDLQLSTRQQELSKKQPEEEFHEELSEIQAQQSFQKDIEDEDE